MDCSLTDEELLSLVLNERSLSREKQAHLGQCVHCQQRLAEIQRVNTILVSRLYRIFCPSSKEISLYCADQLSSDVALNIVKHVLSCPLCTREVADTRNFIKGRSLEPSFTPYAHVRRVIGIMQESQLQLATRGEANSVAQVVWSRQYRAEDINLSLHLNSDNILRGILASTDGANDEDLFEDAEAVLGIGPSLSATGQIPHPKDAPGQHIRVDDLGNFTFPSLPDGEYTLIIHLLDRDIVIEQIMIKQV